MQEINLYDLIKYYAKNWVFIATLTVLGLIGGIIYNVLQTPLYKSDATLLVIDSAETSPPDVTKINNYVALFESRRVLDPVIASQHLHTTYTQLVKSVDATNVKDTEVITVSISSTNPDKSKSLVGAAVTSFMKQIGTLYSTDNVKIVDQASTATPPYNVHKALQLAIATITGFFVSCIVLFFIYDFNSNENIVHKKKDKMAIKHRALYNAGIVLTGRVGFVEPIKKPVSRPVAKKPRVSMKTKIAKSTRTIAYKVMAVKDTMQAIGVKDDKVAATKKTKTTRTAPKKPITKTKSAAARKRHVKMATKKTSSRSVSNNTL